MRPYCYPLYTLAALCFTLSSNAQQKDSFLEAGYLHLQKEFAQMVTIRGSDLEKMPFANLSEAISAWLFGAYTQPAALRYVVDGNRVVDVNAYSIHDIEEVVWVGNAAALGGTTGTQQQLILIRTKRGTTPTGLAVTAQSGLVNAGAPGTTTKTRVYQDYYVGAWRNREKFSMGAAANWTRDVFPLPNQVNIIENTPFHLERWRLNGYLEYRPNRRNRISLTMTFTSAPMHYQADSTGGVPSQVYFFTGPAPVFTDATAFQQLTVPTLRWQADWTSALHNDFMATYLLSRSTGVVNSRHQFLEDTTLVQSFANLNSERRSTHVWIRDRLHYTFSKEEAFWHLSSDLDLSYEHIDLFASNLQSFAVGPVYTPSVGYAPAFYIFGNEDYQNVGSNILLVTPSLDLSYQKTFDLLGGLQWAPSTEWEYGTSAHRYLPFVSLSLDVLHLANSDARNSLKFFASYAQRTVQSIQDYTLRDLNQGLNVNPQFPWYYGAVYTGKPQFYAPLMDSSFTYGLNGKVLTGKIYPVPQYWVWSLGASFTTWQDRLQFQYYFERRNYSTAGVLTLTPTDSVPAFPQWHSTMHYLNMRATLIDEKNLQWTSNLNLTLLRSRTDSMAGIRFSAGEPVVGDTYPHPWSYTGGWTNRVQINDFTAGLDLLYHFGQQGAPGYNPGQSINSVVLPNVFAGYRWHLKHAGLLEGFLETRGWPHTMPSTLLDQRRYFTVGGKFTL